MEQELLEKMRVMEQKIDTMHRSVEKLRKYSLWTLIITFVTIVLPIIALAVVAPWALSVLTSSYSIQ